MRYFLIFIFFQVYAIDSIFADGLTFECNYECHIGFRGRSPKGRHTRFFSTLSGKSFTNGVNIDIEQDLDKKENYLSVEKKINEIITKNCIANLESNKSNISELQKEQDNNVIFALPKGETPKDLNEFDERDQEYFSTKVLFQNNTFYKFFSAQKKIMLIKPDSAKTRFDYDKNDYISKDLNIGKECVDGALRYANTVRSSNQQIANINSKKETQSFGVKN